MPDLVHFELRPKGIVINLSNPGPKKKRKRGGARHEKTKKGNKEKKG
jgi:hypothetical protein